MDVYIIPHRVKESSQCPVKRRRMVKALSCRLVTANGRPIALAYIIYLCITRSSIC